MQASTRGVPRKGLRFGWLEVTVAVAIVAVMSAFMFPIFEASMYPPPDAKWLKKYDEMLELDGLPVATDGLVHHEIDRGTGVVEGRLELDWDEFCRVRKAEVLPGEPTSVVVRTKQDDYARVMKLADGRVRVLTGWDCDRERARTFFAEEMRSGKGRHPAYRKG